MDRTQQDTRIEEKRKVRKEKSEERETAFKEIRKRIQERRGEEVRNA